MIRWLEVTPELKAKQIELQGRLDDLLKEAKQYPLRLCLKVPTDHLSRLEKTVQLLQQDDLTEFVGLVMPDYYYHIDIRFMGEEELEARKQINL